MIFIDSNIIAYAFYQNKFQDHCQKLILQGGITDAVVLIEAFNIIEYQTTKETATNAIRSILKSNITIQEIDVNSIFNSMKITDTQLKFIDLIHYNCARENNCSAIASYDKDFDNLLLPRIEKVE
jgi:predicted nucleic acid-binding protein|tara:strand:+ start:255 stop:629 length:375 start_codon:yes stop_codon:yes gene_type:complete